MKRIEALDLVHPYIGITPFDPTESDGVRRLMRSNKSKGTSPELLIRRALREVGCPGYRLNWMKTPGKPDICCPGRRVAIFVNGCFWHRCPKCNVDHSVRAIQV